MNCGCNNNPCNHTTTTTTVRVYENQEPCVEVILSDCVEYNGPVLPCLGIVPGEKLTSILDKINDAVCVIQNLTTTTTLAPEVCATIPTLASITEDVVQNNVVFLEMNWTTEDPVHRIHIYRSFNNGATYSFGSTVTYPELSSGATISQAQQLNTTVLYKIQAECENGELSEFSNVFSFTHTPATTTTTLSVCPIPTITNVVKTGGNVGNFYFINLSWSTSTPVNKILVYTSTNGGVSYFFDKTVTYPGGATSGNITGAQNLGVSTCYKIQAECEPENITVDSESFCYTVSV